MCGSVTGIYKTITILLSVLIKVKKSHIMRIGGGFMLVRFSVENFLSFFFLWKGIKLKEHIFRI